MLYMMYKKFSKFLDMNEPKDRQGETMTTTSTRIPGGAEEGECRELLSVVVFTFQVIDNSEKYSEGICINEVNLAFDIKL